MTNNLIHQMQSQLDSQALETLSILLKAPVPQTRLGASIAIPVLLSSISQSASDGKLELITERLQKIDPNKAGHLSTALTLFGDKLIMGGGKMLDLLIGDTTPMVQSIASYTSLEEPVVGQLLSAFTPILMGTIRRELGESEPITAPQVQQYLQGQTDVIARALPQAFLEHAEQAGLELVVPPELPETVPATGPSSHLGSLKHQDSEHEGIEHEDSEYEDSVAESSAANQESLQDFSASEAKDPSKLVVKELEPPSQLEQDGFPDDVAATFGHLKASAESKSPEPETAPAVSAAEAARAKLATITRVDGNGTARHRANTPVPDKTPVPDQPKEVRVSTTSTTPAKPSASQWLSGNDQKTRVISQAEDISTAGFNLFPFRKYLLIALGAAVLLYVLLGILS